MMLMLNHTFVILAYGVSPYLEMCVCSLMRQNLGGSHLLISTSTDNAHIRDIAYRYGIPVFVHDGNGLGSDWNYGVACAETDFVTLVHQDDVYLKHYLDAVMTAFLNHPKGIIAFTDYAEIKDGCFVAPGIHIKIKHMMLKVIDTMPYNKTVRRQVLAFGNPICCPSVTYNRDLIGDIVFNENWKTNIDWSMWERFSTFDGAFLHIPEKLIGHRIHEGSTTTAVIDGGNRGSEDLAMLRRFWPKAAADFLYRFYALGEKANNPIRQ